MTLTVVKPTRRNKQAAPGPYLGFGLQTVRLCHHLLSAPLDASVSVEYEDDVSVHYANGAILLEQTKSALNSEPLAEKSKDLWKTFANWVDWDEGPPSRATSIAYHLYVTPPKPGLLSQEMAAASSTAAVSVALEKLAKLKTTAAKPPEWQRHLRSFLSATPAAQAYIVANFSLTSTDVDPVDPIRAALSVGVKEDILDEVCRWLIGHAKLESDALLRKKQPGIISVRAFRNALQDFLSKLRSPALASMAPKPSPGAVQQQLQKEPVFVRQLDLIGATEKQRMSAAADYLQSVADKVLWTATGKIFKPALDTWDADLLGLHESVCDEVTLTQPQLVDQARGRLVYARCRQLQASIEGQMATVWFIHGSLHELADDRRLGWHLDFDTLL